MGYEFSNNNIMNNYNTTAYNKAVNGGATNQAQSLEPAYALPIPSVYGQPIAVDTALPAMAGPGRNIAGGTLAENYLRNISNQIQGGTLPSLKELTDSFPVVDPESPQAQATLARVTKLLQQSGPQGELRARQFSTSMALKQLDATTGGLNRLSPNLDPMSPQAQSLQARIQGIAAQKAELQARLDKDLAMDSSKGGQIQLNGNNYNKPGYPPPPNNQSGDIQGMLLNLMTQMLRMFLQMFQGQGRGPMP